jgi:hypothetical protein
LRCACKWALLYYGNAKFPAVKSQGEPFDIDNTVVTLASSP